MPPTPAQLPRQNQAHHQAHHLAHVQALVDAAVAGGSALMGKLVSGALAVLSTLEHASVDLRKRDALAASALRLTAAQAALCVQFPSQLQNTMGANRQAGQAAAAIDIPLDMDQLELMDPGQVEERVTLARIQQSVVLATEAQLAELDTLVCSALGLHVVRPERNPLRPETYLNALNDTLEACAADTAMRLEWLTVMGGVLGSELRMLYPTLANQLRGAGVRPADYGLVPGAKRTAAFAAPVSKPPPSPVVDRRAATAPSTGYEGRKTKGGADAADTLLTLEKLHRLLSGNQDRARVAAQANFAAHFAQTFERGNAVDGPPAAVFDATVPAALVALKDMQQVDRVVRNLAQGSGGADARASAVAGASGSVAPAAAQGAAFDNKEVVRTLSLEVVKLMVENMACDRRLLPPIQRLIRRLEPALAQLSLADPRLFTDKQHTARRLVEAIAHQSLAYPDEETTGFSDFLAQVERGVAPLLAGGVDSGEPFDQVLTGLQRTWKLATQAAVREQDKAVKALEHAEARNVLAEKIARQISNHADAAKVPAVVVEFLCGPWAQVVAHARIASGAGTGAADRYQALISALLWSAHPELTLKNTAKLTQLVPLLLSTLREGLATIHYPPLQTSAFLEALMGLHQRAFRVNQKPADAPSAAPLVPVQSTPAPTAMPDAANPWLAPEEAQASNLMELTEASEPAAPAVDRGVVFVTSYGAQPSDPAGAMPTLDALPLGTWVELRVKDQWVRTQLTWASPHGTLFLFTSVFGTTQSMTRRSGEKLVAAGNLRVIASTPMVDGAMDAVAQQAMRNSVRSGGA